MEKHLLPKALPFWKKNSHISSKGLIRSHSELLVGKKKTYPKQAEPSNDEPTNAKSLFQFPKKKKHSRTSIFWRLGLFFWGKKPPNLRNINFQQEKHLSLGWTSVSAAWWSTWTFACLYHQTSRASRWEPNVPQETSLEKSCCVLLYLFFRRKHKQFLVGGRGWVKKTSNNQLCFLEIWLKKPTGN